MNRSEALNVLEIPEYLEPMFHYSGEDLHCACPYCFCPDFVISLKYEMVYCFGCGISGSWEDYYGDIVDFSVITRMYQLREND